VAEAGSKRRERSAERAGEGAVRSAGQGAEKSSEKSAGRSAGQGVEKSAGQGVEKSAGKSGNKKGAGRSAGGTEGAGKSSGKSAGGPTAQTILLRLVLIIGSGFLLGAMIYVLGWLTAVITAVLAAGVVWVVMSAPEGPDRPRRMLAAGTGLLLGGLTLVGVGSQAIGAGLTLLALIVMIVAIHTFGRLGPDEAQRMKAG
jgi:hypothetical protein